MVSVVVSISYKSLGGGIKSLGDGVKTSAGSERNMSSINSMVSISGISKTMKTISVSKMTIVGIGISLTFAKMVSVVVSVSYKSLGGGIKSLGDGVKTGAGSEGDSVISISISGISKTKTISISHMTIVGI